jgi:hypothetical protein
VLKTATAPVTSKIALPSAAYMLPMHLPNEGLVATDGLAPSPVVCPVGPPWPGPSRGTLKPPAKLPPIGGAGPNSCGEPQ